LNFVFSLNSGRFSRPPRNAHPGEAQLDGDVFATRDGRFHYTLVAESGSIPFPTFPRVLGSAAARGRRGRPTIPFSGRAEGARR